MTLLLLALGCTPWHEERTTTSLVSGGGTASTFYVLVSEQTYDKTSWPGGYSSMQLVDDDATLVRCDVSVVTQERKTSCGAAITLGQASDAAHRPISFTTRSADMPQGSDSANRCAALRKRLDQIIATGTLSSELPSLPPECQ